MSDTLYEQDFWRWSQQQAAALKRRASGGNALDYDNLAEEVAALGRSERAAVFSYVARIIEHLHKLSSSRAVDPRQGWEDEIRGFRVHVANRMTPSIRGMTNRRLDKLHADGAQFARAALRKYEPDVQVDAGRRWSLAQILGERDDPLDEEIRP